MIGFLTIQLKGNNTIHTNINSSDYLLLLIFLLSLLSLVLLIMNWKIRLKGTWNWKTLLLRTTNT